MRGLFVVLLLVAACDDEDSSGRPFTPILEIDTQLQAATCTHLVACHAMPDQATCLSTNLYAGGFYVEPRTLQLVLTGKVRYDGGLVAKCLADVAAQSCTLNALDRRVSFAQCVLDVYRGSVAAGGVCSADAECTSGTCSCSLEDASCCSGTCLPGVATPFTPNPIGAACQQASGGFNSCTPDAFCDQATNICTALEPAGASCISDSECGDGLKCNFAATQSTSTCTAVPHLGESCATIAICGDEGTYCDSQTHLCTAVKFVGAPCATGGCASPLRCDPQTLLCATYPVTGASCVDEGRCNDFGTYCNQAEICALPKPNGAACNSGLDCASQMCDFTMMKCVAPPTCP